MTVYAISVSKT